MHFFFLCLNIIKIKIEIRLIMINYYIYFFLKRQIILFLTKIKKKISYLLLSENEESQKNLFGFFLQYLNLFFSNENLYKSIFSLRKLGLIFFFGFFTIFHKMTIFSSFKTFFSFSFL
jgi:hypothetical protein